MIENNLVAFGCYFPQNFWTLSEGESLRSEGVFYFKVGQVAFVFGFSTRDFFGKVLSQDIFCQDTAFSS